MRCYSILRPVDFKKWHSKLSMILIPTIWCFGIIMLLLPSIISTQMLTEESTKEHNELYGYSWHIVYIAITIFPAVLTVFLYLAQIYILHRKRNDGSINTQSIEKMKSLEKMIRMVSIGTFVCYLPNIIWKQWTMVTVRSGTTYERYDSTLKVSFNALS